ncbi:MAG: NitT/TauT family transport system ATP-binding protein [Bradyrhizobium sp.]|jgi:NitT/TauT family transport system ATP-binding protein|nr:NitT/TauT family transport system ATP-binding protein [Bradyrhizobium sp.]
MIQRIGATADRIFRCRLDPGGKTILENIRLDVKPGEFLCNVGASGCGKTTALRLAAGLYQPTDGAVSFDGKPVRMPRRDIATVFQDYGKALLPWRTAAGNVSLALEASHVASSRKAARITCPPASSCLASSAI